MMRTKNFMYIVLMWAVFGLFLVSGVNNVSAYGSRPVAVLSAGVTTTCAGSPVHFYGGDSYDPDGQIQQYLYEYGDGSDSHWVIGLDYTYHTYHNPGTYYAKLRVKDNDMQISDYSNYAAIQVLNCAPSDHYPVINTMSLKPQYPDADDDLECSATFSDIDNDLSHVIFKWYRNGGVVREQTYNACDGCYSAEDALYRNTIDAGDKVKCEVVVYDYDGRMAVDSKSVQVEYSGTKPTAILDADDVDICPGQYVRLDGSDSYDPDGYVKQYYYEFGDGSVSPWITDTSYTHHKYTEEGTFYARLKVKDNLYQESDWSNHVRITVRDDCNGGSDDPFLRMEVTPSSPTTTEDIRCEVDVTDDDGDLNRVEIEWSVDGRYVRSDDRRVYGYSDSVWFTLSSTYTDEGDKVTCSATVYDDDHNRDSESVYVYVEEDYHERTPVAVIEADDNSICVGEAVVLDGSASYNLDGYAVRYYSFETDDGAASGWDRDSDYTYTYEDAGTYTAKLRVKDTQGKISNYDTTIIRVSDEGECAPNVCGVEITDFDFLASGKTGNELWARAKVRNTGNEEERINLYLYIDDELEDQYTMTIHEGSQEAKKFYFRVNEPGNREVRVSAYADCGASDEKDGIMDIVEGYTPEPGPEPDPLRVNIYPKTLDMRACDGGSITIEMTTPTTREFEFEVSGLRDEWIEIPNDMIVDGTKKAYVFVNPMQPGNYDLLVTVRTGDKVFTQNVYLYVAPADMTQVGGDNGDDLLTGLFSAGLGNWVLGLVILIILVIIIAMLARSGRKEKRPEYIGRYEDRNQGNYPPQYYPANNNRPVNYGV